MIIERDLFLGFRFQGEIEIVWDVGELVSLCLTLDVGNVGILF